MICACQECGNQSSKWLGRCHECGNWNTYVEEQVRADPAARPTGGRRVAVSTAQPMPLAQVRFAQSNRLRLAMRELNEVLGGGIVPGSLVLVGGDPGIGKSTLLLQLASDVAGIYGPVLYVSGEESVQQLKLRAQRLGIDGDRLMVLAENDLDIIVGQLASSRPMMVVIDSIQTVFMSGVTSAPGSVSQVRECAGQLMVVAKSSQIPIFLVGHVNKEGAIAGPRVLEHIVDTVLYLEGERHHTFRILRSQKNRFGSTDEIGVFEMRDSGMHEVTDPSRAFLQDRSLSEVGNVVHVALEGTRRVSGCGRAAGSGALGDADARRGDVCGRMGPLLGLAAEAVRAPIRGRCYPHGKGSAAGERLGARRDECGMAPREAIGRDP